MANNGSNYGMVSRCPRLESNVTDLEEDCAPETSPFRDTSSCDIYSRGSAHPFPRPESYHQHGQKSSNSQQLHQQQEFDSVMSSSEYSSEYFLTDNSVDSLHHKNLEVDNLGTDLDTLRISDLEKRNSTQQPEVTKTEVAIDDEAIGSIASTDSIFSTEIEKSRQLYQQDEDGDT